MDTNNVDYSIPLKIKAPNQQIDDQIIECQPDWSVAKLKGHIHELYPNKPKIKDQRLIYSGQLLTDGVILKDVLKPYDEDGQLNLTVHLVCSSSSYYMLPKETSITKPNIKRADIKYPKNYHNGASSCKSYVQTLPKNRQNAYPFFSNNTHDIKSISNQTKKKASAILLGPEQIACQQLLWMNRMYAIHMTKYWQSVATNLGASLQSSTQTNESSPNVPNNNDNNIQNNVDHNNMNRIIQEAGPNQDWLDWLYVSSRVFIFISVLYFYSSPGRFIVVAGFALLFYLYQSGILRHINEHNRRGFQPEQNVNDNRNVPQEQNEDTDNTTIRQNERLIATLWTVISTFFTSLIPQQPDVI